MFVPSYFSYVYANETMTLKSQVSVLGERWTEIAGRCWWSGTGVFKPRCLLSTRWWNPTLSAAEQQQVTQPWHPAGRGAAPHPRHPSHLKKWERNQTPLGWAHRPAGAFPARGTSQPSPFRAARDTAGRAGAELCSFLQPLETRRDACCGRSVQLLTLWGFFCNFWCLFFKATQWMSTN